MRRSIDSQGREIYADLSPALLPPSSFPEREWFYASGHWFYHRCGPSGAVALDERFYELVDPCLRGLCRALHARGIRTTPSCEGHFHPPAHFRRVFAELVRDADAVRAGGLPVESCETGEEALFRAPAYVLPWRDAEVFCAEASRGQGQGFLGLVLPDEQAGLVVQLLRDRYTTPRASIRLQPGAEERHGGALFVVAVEARSPDERDREWRGVEDYLRAVVGD